MYHYMPETEPATERALLVTITKPEYGYAHIEARVVRKAKPFIEGEKGHDDGRDAKGWRNATWSTSTKSGLCVEGFTVRCQMNVPEYKPYGADCVFMDYGRVTDRAEVKHMADTFAKLDKGLKKLEDSFGWVSSDDYAGLLLRVADVLKIRKFLFYRKGFDGSSLDVRDAFMEHEAGYVKHAIERLIELQQPKKEEVSA